MYIGLIMSQERDREKECKGLDWDRERKLDSTQDRKVLQKAAQEPMVDRMQTLRESKGAQDILCD